MASSGRCLTLDWVKEQAAGMTVDEAPNPQTFVEAYKQIPHIGTPEADRVFVVHADSPTAAIILFKNGCVAQSYVMPWSLARQLMGTGA